MDIDVWIQEGLEKLRRDGKKYEVEVAKRGLPWARKLVEQRRPTDVAVESSAKEDVNPSSPPLPSTERSR